MRKTTKKVATKAAKKVAPKTKIAKKTKFISMKSAKDTVKINGEETVVLNSQSPVTPLETTAPVSIPEPVEEVKAQEEVKPTPEASAPVSIIQPVFHKKLNIGCGIHFLTNFGFENIDANPKYNAHATIMKIEDIIQQPGSIDEIYVGHCLEHLINPVKELKRWKDWLKTGGILWIVIPEHARVKYAVENGIEQMFTYEGIMKGHQNGDMNSPSTHKTQYTEATFMAQLIEAGFKKEQIKLIDAPYDECPYLFSRISWQLVAKITK
ncbi:MAG: hypothetical protein PHX21_12825 [bacterium]|nr:hypothetical protein [bacterium]